jgi:hypothetical protein
MGRGKRCALHVAWCTVTPAVRLSSRSAVIGGDIGESLS